MSPLRNFGRVIARQERERHLLRRTTDARVGHGLEMVAVVTLSFKPGQKQETNRRSEERLSQPGIARAEERQATSEP